jgi:hypothetical protein
MGGACGTDGSVEKYNILYGKPDGKRSLEDKSVDRRILKCILGNRVGWCGMDAPGQDRNQWWALVNTVIIIMVP